MNKRLSRIGVSVDLFKKDREELYKIKYWKPQEGMQERVFLSILDNSINEVAYGGVRGSGKSDVGINGILDLMFLLGDKFNGYYLRNKLVDLLGVIDRVKQALIREGFRLHKDFNYNSQQKILTLSNGAKLRFFYIEGSGLDSLQGENVSHIILEEPQQIRNIENTVMPKIISMWRTPYKEVTPKIIWLFNPLGPSNKYLKKKYVDNGSGNLIKEESTGLSKIYYFASREDNKILIENNPSYYKNLENLPPNYRKAWLDGSFDNESGVAFDILTKDNNGFDGKNFRPDSNPWYISLDWGYREKTAVGFYCLYRGSILIKFDELVFNRKTPSEAADLIKTVMSRYNEDNYQYGIADSAIWNETQGDSIGSVLEKEGLSLYRATKGREAGYLKMYSVIKEQKLLIYNNLDYFWETVPSLLYSEKDQSDIEQSPKQDDHGYDETRYMIMDIFS